MNRKDLVDELSRRFEGNREVAAQALDSVVDVISRSISAGEKVAISGFGEFERKARDAGAKAGEYVPEFKPGKELREVVSGAREWRDRVTGSLAVVPAAAVEQASRAAASTMRSVAEKARELAAELASAGEPGDVAAPASAGSGRTAKKAPAKKTAAKKTAAKKTAAKKSTAGRPTAKKASAAKKSTAKKTPAKSSAKKTATAKETTAAQKTAAAKKASGAKRSST